MDDVAAASRFLSLVLRHRPELIGLVLDAAGWADIDDLILRAQPQRPLTRALLDRAVAENDKNRFEISADGSRIRARQGHSIAVDPGLTPMTPPPRLYHGTATRFVDGIRREGLRRGSRQHVHLSTDAETAARVGTRHGRPVVLVVRAVEMAETGHVFHLSSNGVWLTEAVPSAFIDFGEV